MAPRADAEAEEEAAIGAGIVAADLPGVVRAVAQSDAGILAVSPKTLLVQSWLGAGRLL